MDIWMSSEKSCGKGFGSEAIRVLCEHLIKSRGVKNFIIRPWATNTRAVRAYEKTGFVRVPDENKQNTVKEYYKEEYWDIYGQGDYGAGDDVVLVRAGLLP